MLPRVLDWMRFLIIGIAIAVVTILVTSLALDRVLGLLGFPSEYVAVAHPPHCVEERCSLEFDVEFRTNSHGLRYREVPLTKPDSTTRWVVIGDSFTEGWGVQAPDRFTEQLEGMLSTPAQSYEFVNCGLAGTGPVEYARILSEIGFDYHPDAVLIALYPNDIVDTEEDAIPDDIDHWKARYRSGLKKTVHDLWPRLYSLVKSLKPKGSDGPSEVGDLVGDVVEEARSEGIPESDIEAWVQNLPQDLVDAANQGYFNGHILAKGLLMPDHWVQSLDIDCQEAEARYQAMQSILNEAISRCRDAGIPVALVLLPAPVQVSPDVGTAWQQAGVELRPEWLSEPTECERRLDEYARQQQLPFLNLAPLFRDAQAGWQGPPLFYPLDGHFTPEGHRLAAEFIADWLAEQNVTESQKSEENP